MREREKLHEHVDPQKFRPRQGPPCCRISRGLINRAKMASKWKPSHLLFLKTSFARVTREFEVVCRRDIVSESPRSHLSLF